MQQATPQVDGVSVFEGWSFVFGIGSIDYPGELFGFLWNSTPAHPDFQIFPPPPQTLLHQIATAGRVLIMDQAAGSRMTLLILSAVLNLNFADSGAAICIKDPRKGLHGFLVFVVCAWWWVVCDSSAAICIENRISGIIIGSSACNSTQLLGPTPNTAVSDTGVINMVRAGQERRKGIQAAAHQQAVAHQQQQVPNILHFVFGPAVAPVANDGPLYDLVESSEVLAEITTRKIWWTKKPWEFK
jgi:hypothetical protein